MGQHPSTSDEAQNHIEKILDSDASTSAKVKKLKYYAEHYRKELFLQCKSPNKSNKEILEGLDLWKSKDYGLTVAAENSSYFEWLSEEVRSDKDVILAFSKTHHFKLDYIILNNLKGDGNFIISACRLQPSIFKLASDELRSDREYVLKIVAENGNVLEYVKDEFKDDEQVVRAAIENHGPSLQFASVRLRNDLTLIQVSNVKTIENIQTGLDSVMSAFQ